MNYWKIKSSIGEYSDVCINGVEYKVDDYIEKFVKSNFFIHLKDFTKYGKLTVAFYWFLMSKQVGIAQRNGHCDSMSTAVFKDSYYRGWVSITAAGWKKIKSCLDEVGVSWDKNTQNTESDLVAYENGTYKSAKEIVEQDLFTSISRWKLVSKMLKKSKEYDEMNDEVQEQVMEDKSEEQAVEEQVEQAVEEQVEEKPVVEEKPMEEREEFSAEVPAVEEQQVVDKKVQHAEANRRYKEKKEAERVATAAAVAEVIDYFKSIGKWEEIREDTRTILLKYAYKTTGNSIVAKVFGDCVKVGDTVTVEQVFRITQMGIKEFQKKLNEWEQKDGVKVEYKENPDNIFASTYTIVEC